MKIVVAPDSFKESRRTDVAAAMARGIALAAPHARIQCVPMADGGEGTVHAVLAAITRQNAGRHAHVMYWRTGR